MCQDAAEGGGLGACRPNPAGLADQNVPTHAGDYGFSNTLSERADSAELKVLAGKGLIGACRARLRDEPSEPSAEPGNKAVPRLPKESPSRAFFLLVRLVSNLAVCARTSRWVREVGAGKWIARGPDDHWEKRDSPIRLWKQHQPAGRGGISGELIDYGEENTLCQ